ncbi:MAG: hypothetical protein ACR2LM_01710 [Pyrinomonadaceae bacterium]
MGRFYDYHNEVNKIVRDSGDEGDQTAKEHGTDIEGSGGTLWGKKSGETLSNTEKSNVGL